MQKVYNLVNNDQYFAAFFVFSNLLSAFIYTYPLYQFLLPISLAWGLVRLIDLFLVKRTIFRRNSFWILFAFGASYAITILLNYKYSVFTNIGQLLCVCIYFFVLYCNNTSRPLDDLLVIVKTCVWTAVGCTFVIVVTSFWMYLTGYSRTIVKDGIDARVGLNIRGASSVQLFGSSASSSVLGTAIAAACALLLILLLLTDKKKKWLRVALWCSLGMYLFVSTAADAFTCLGFFLGFVCIFVFIELLKRERYRLLKLWKKILVVLVCEAVTIAMVVIGYSLMQQVNNVVYHVGSEVRSALASTDEPDANIIPPQRAETLVVGRNISSSATGSRTAIWKEGLKLFFKSPLGITEQRIEVWVMIGNTLVPYYNLHNGYLTILVSSGIIGFLLIAVFGLNLGFRQMHSLYHTGTNSQADRLRQLLISFIGGVLAIDLVNGCFVLWRGYYYVLFWMFLGCVVALKDNNATTNQTVSSLKG